MKLYKVTTMVSKYHGCKNVQFIWFRCDHGSPKRLYAELIQKYDPEDYLAYYVEDHIEELFTEGEARSLKEYLDREHGHEGTTTISEMELPIPNNLAGVGAMAVGGGDDFYVLSEDPEYYLPFRVWGYFDLVGCELLDGADVYHHRLWLLGPNGEMRQQSNEEAAEFVPF